MPRLWSATIEAHRRSVHEATLDAVARLVAQLGLRGVTMSRIADETGIGRATLYKYFPDVESALAAWHERQIQAHVDRLIKAGDQAATPGERLEAVLEAYTHAMRESGRHSDHALVALLHGNEHVVRAGERVRSIVRELVVEAAAAGDARDDVAPDELARFCIAALGAATALRSKAAARRLLDVTLDALRPAA